MTRHTGINILLSLTAVFLALLIVEVLGRYYFAHRPNYDFEMWRYAAEMKQPLADPLLPFHHKSNKSGVYYGVEIRTNGQGFRDVEQQVPKPAGVKRVVMLGDSFTLGWGVPFADTFSKVLEKKLQAQSNHYEVINMGVGNYNSSMELELFKRKGLALEPDIVVLMYYINDTEPAPVINRFGYPLLKHFYTPSYMGAKLKQIEMMRGDRDWLQAYYRRLYQPDAAGFRIARSAINELIRITAEKNMKLLMVNIPDLHRLQNYPFDFATALPRGLAEKKGVPFLDLLPAFARYEGRALWVTPEDAHMSSMANGIAAQEIFEKLVAERMVEP